MPNGKRIAWIAVAGSVLLVLWLGKNASKDSELQKWLELRGLTNMERPLKALGNCIEDVHTLLYCRCC